MEKLVLLLAVAALAVGCGGGGGSSGETAGKAKSAKSARAGEDFDVSESEIGGSAAFRNGFNTCQLYPLEELARQNNVKAEPVAVAEAVAAFETTPKDKKDVRAGCLEALNFDVG